MLKSNILSIKRIIKFVLIAVFSFFTLPVIGAEYSYIEYIITPPIDESYKNLVSSNNHNFINEVYEYKPLFEELKSKKTKEEKIEKVKEDIKNKYKEKIYESFKTELMENKTVSSLVKPVETCKTKLNTIKNTVNKDLLNSIEIGVKKYAKNPTLSTGISAIDSTKSAIISSTTKATTATIKTVSSTGLTISKTALTTLATVSSSATSIGTAIGGTTTGVIAGFAAPVVLVAAPAYLVYRNRKKVKRWFKKHF